MSYFLPSYLQKRILRYALSQVELLDTDALDLDKLDIGWGRQSTVEIRDVGVHTKRLATLLKLPPALAIVSAQMLLLRLTIPSDLYKSGILVDVEGVKVCVSADLHDQEYDRGKRPKVHRHRSDGASRASQGHKPRESQHHLHDPGGTRRPSKTDDHFAGHIPTPVDLAKSFLHTEPSEEKANLRASVTKAGYLDQPHSSSEDGEEKSAVGIGSNLSLPAFLADFLKGVGDRIQLKIREVELDLNCKVDQFSQSSFDSDTSSRLEDVTIRLAIDSIFIEGVSRSDVTGSPPDRENNVTSGPREIRRITLSSLEAMVISEASLFQNLARSTVPSSPETNRASEWVTSHSKASSAQESHSTSLQDTLSQGLGSTNTRYLNEKLSVSDSIDGQAEQMVTPERAVNEHPHSVPVDPNHPGTNRMQDRDETGEDAGSLSGSSLHSEYASYMDSAGSPTESKSQSDRRHFKGEETPPATFGTFHTASNPDDAADLYHGLNFQKEPMGSQSTAQNADPVILEASYSASNRSSPASEDLAQSKIFTHEEASMYMSAISQASDARGDRYSSVPGNWASSDSEDGSDQVASHTGTGSGLVHEHSDEYPNQSEILKNDAVLGRNPQQVGSDHIASEFQTAKENDRSMTEPAADLRPEDEMSHSPPRKDHISIPSSETSSTNIKGSLTIAKRLLFIENVLIALPLTPGSVDEFVDADDPPFGKSNKNMPGGFRQNLEASTVSFSSITSEYSNVFEGPQDDQICSVEVDNMEILGDMGLTRMLILVSQQINTALNLGDSSPKNRTKTEPPVRESRKWRLTLHEASWKFLDAVKGKPISIAQRKSAINDPYSFPGEPEVLLRATIRNFEVIHCEAVPSTSTTAIIVGTFSFGYPSTNILCFDPKMKMRQSTRDALGPVGNDIVLTVTRSSQSHRYELRTLPLHVALDLRRLDETFSWFGGFSSILGLGSSMVSTMTITDARPKQSRSSKPSRGVHFESPSSTNAAKTTSLQPRNKVTVRIGGLVFDVEGSQSSLRFDSSAIKLVTRSEGLGLQIDRLNLSGPFGKQIFSDPTLKVKVMNLRVEYSPTPDEVDLARLLELLSPSKDQDSRDDDILLERLFRQRRQGAVVRVSIEKLDGDIQNISDLECFPMLIEELKRLSNVTKYLPEDDRAGMLILGSVKKIGLAATINSSFGVASLACGDLEGAHVTFPTLTTLSINMVDLYRNRTEQLLGATSLMEFDSNFQLPTVRARFLGNEMEPTAKIKLCGLRIEYFVSTVMAMMGLEDVSSAESIIADMVSSVATITNRHISSVTPPKPSKQSSPSSDRSIPNSMTLRLDVSFRDCIIGLNPRKSSAKGLFVITDAHFLGAMPRDKAANADLDIRKASIMVVDDIKNLTSTIDRVLTQRASEARSTQIETLSTMGYVSIGTISAAKATIQVSESGDEPNEAIDVVLRDDLFVLETCADSTQTLLDILNGLSPPTPPSTELKYRTEVVPIEDMLASFSGDVFATTRSSLEPNESSLGLDEAVMMDDEVPQNLEFVSSLYNPHPNATYDHMADSMLEDDLDSLTSPSVLREIGDSNLLESFEDQAQVAPGNEPLDFQEGHFGVSSSVEGTAHRWDTARNTYGLSGDKMLRSSPLQVRVRDVHFIWNLFDGYDWQHTRDTISQAVEAVQMKAAERLAHKDKRKSLDFEEEEESVIGDFLFNSIYIGIPANRDPRELPRQVSRDLDDLVSEAESNTLSNASSSPSRQGRAPRPKSKTLRLKRSRYHKMTFELKGISVDVVVFPPRSGETQSSIDVRIQDLEIFDHVPTSTWKKFATYMHDAGERESGTSMVHVEILNVKPVPDLAASEIVMKATVLPLRLHVDQDALDFLTRFFEFRGDTALVETSKAEPPFFQRVEVNSIQVRLDFKPKRVDYGGIRSGHTTEFMNFFILDRADMVLRHVILRGGISGFDKVGKMLNDIWMPDIKRNQLPGILAGLAPVRSLVNVGGGVRDLVAIPIREYRKDGRVVRSFQKGAVAFARTTTGELVKLGAKLAIGTQTMLQGAEDLLAQPSAGSSDVSRGWEDAGLDEEEKKQISLYADQPIGVVQGLRGAYASLEQDLLTAKDAIVAIPGEVMESGTARGAAKAVLRGAPTVILRPAMGVSKAVGQTLLGATNSLDPGNRRRIEDKYKRH